MTEPFDLDRIRRYWSSQAVTHGPAVAASWSDRQAVEMEIAAVTARLNDGDSVLDAGCANAFSTLRFAAARRVRIRGIDLIPEMIAVARERYEAERLSLLGTLDLDVGDVLDLREPDAAYDKVISIRVVINLGDWDRQRRALHELVRVLRPGGLLLLSEATLQGWHQLNAFRGEWGLPPIPMPPFNRYLDQEAVIGELADEAELVELSDFASTYFVGTRVLKPLLVRALGADVDAADPEMHWNRFWSRLPAWGDYGTQKLFTFRKR